MNREIIFTREEYKEKYNGLMQSFKLEYADYEEIDFINNEIKRYRDFIKDLDWLVMCKLAEATGIPIDFQRLIDFRLEKKCVINFPDLIDDQKEKLLILSFNKIIEFLELKKGNPNQCKNNSKAPLTISEIALKCFYEGTIITRENAVKYLIGSGRNSGEKLYLEFCKWSNRTDRKSDPETKVRLNNKIKIFEKVIAELPENKKEIAKDELQILYSFMHKYQ